MKYFILTLGLFLTTNIGFAQETKRLISIEDHNIIGGLGSAISEVLTSKFPAKLERMGMNDEFGRSGKAEELIKFYHLDAEAIVNKF